MKQIAVLTSGGDAPGMNAAIRAVVRTGIDKGWQVCGVNNGYHGLLNDNIIPLGARDVGGVIQRGGTILGSSRSPEFETEEGQLKAIRNLKRHDIEALIVIGGNGSQQGAFSLSKRGFPIVGIASTIDNDLYGPDITLGVDTALNIALEAIDRLKVTASSHQRAFLVEVMGRNCGYLAMMSGIAGGAEYVVLPEVDTDPEEIAQRLRADYQKGKQHAIIVVAEGAKYNAEKLSAYFKKHQERLGFDLRMTIIGHVQRGGAPGAFDRLLGTRMGAAATDALTQKKEGVLVGLYKGEISTLPLENVVSHKKKLDLKLLKLAKALNK
ncbi:MAG: 6-phosphofructokinase [Dehalococcoidales bacterium]|nr:6-phosphofructokinase [Dehalococcoidales bacterium]